MRRNSACNALIPGAYNGEELPADQVLEGARHLKRVLIIGETDQGELRFLASTGDRRWSHPVAKVFMETLQAD